MSKAARTPMDIAHVYAFSLEGLKQALDDQTIYEDKPFRKLDGEMLRLRLAGVSMPKIAEMFGVSRTRVFQRTTRMLRHCMHTRQRRRWEQLSKQRERGENSEAG